MCDFNEEKDRNSDPSQENPASQPEETPFGTQTPQGTPDSAGTQDFQGSQNPYGYQPSGWQSGQPDSAPNTGEWQSGRSDPTPNAGEWQSGQQEQQAYNSYNSYGYQNQNTTPGYNRSTGGQDFGHIPSQNASEQEYQWKFEDYDRISQSPDGYKPSNNTGLKVFAMVMTIVFLITAVAFGGFLAYYFRSGKSSNTTGQAGAESSLSASTPSPDTPKLDLNSRPGTEEENYTDGVLSTEQIAAKVRPSVVGIVTYMEEYPMQAYGTGSGIIMTEDGYIITNAHVVSGATGGILVVLENEEEYEAQIVGIDEKTDLAVVKIDAKNLTAAEFGDSDELVVGERIVAIGNPTGLNLAGTTTQGIVSGLNRTIQVTNETTKETIEMEAIQVDAAINPGNSGGALINKYGQVVGINSSKLSSTTIEGIGFAIPITTAKPIVDDLIAYGYVKGRVLLGISYYPISDALGEMNGYIPGLWVQTVNENMDVYAKGLRAGDVITQMDGKDVRDTQTVKEIMGGKVPGDTVTLTVIRKDSVGKTNTFTIVATLAEDTGSSTQNQKPSSDNQDEGEESSSGGLTELP